MKKIFVLLLIFIFSFSLFSCENGDIIDQDSSSSSIDESGIVVETDESEIKVESVSLNVSSITIYENSTRSLIVTIIPSNATNKKVTFSSSNDTVVTVDSSGIITAKKVGTATITVLTEDGGYSVTCSITVKGEEKGSETGQLIIG